MKITLITKGKTEEVIDLINASEKYNVELNIESDLNFNNIKTKINEMGDAVIFRASDLSRIDKVSFCKQLISKGKILINNAYLSQPMLPYKSYQQSAITKIPDIKGIATYKCKDRQQLNELLESGKLKFPFISKPDWGKMGIGVELIKDHNDIDKLFESTDVKNSIFQNFIKNKCDFRIIVVGGKPLGVLKRIAKTGSHLNNISQGGRGEHETTPELVNKLFSASSKIANLFELGLAGVDIIQDEVTNELYFMEVNTAPQWGGDQGFQAITGIPVADEIIKYCKNRYLAASASTEKELAGIILEQMNDRSNSLGGYEFHFLTRVYLWTRNSEYLKKLNTLKDSYTQRVKTINKPQDRLTTELLSPNTREYFFQKYPLLKFYNSLLFKVLFAESIYNADIRGDIQKIVSDDDFIQLYKEIYSDTEAVKYLSTHAINYFYLLRNYLGDAFTDNNLAIDLDYIIDIAQTKYTDSLSDRKLKVYLLTHCIIGESKFYQTKVKAPQYIKMLEILNDYILENPMHFSLDNKFEFLVCCRICEFKPSTLLESLIYSEAKMSLAQDGIYLSDRNNLSVKSKKDYVSSEHRNVLFVMSNLEYKAPTTP